MKKVIIVFFTLTIMASFGGCDDGGDGSGAGKCYGVDTCFAYPYVPDLKYTKNWCSSIGGVWDNSPTCSTTNRVARCSAESNGYSFTAHYYSPYWDTSTAEDDCDTVFGIFIIGK